MQLTRTQFEDELEGLRSQLLEMGSRAAEMVQNAMTALANRDLPLAEQVIKDDDIVDELDLQIENECIRLIALQQPIARDLRLVGTALKIITDLERIGDNAVDIAKVARKLVGDTDVRLVDFAPMANAVSSMIRDSMEAFVKHDLELASRAVETDDKVDDIFHDIRGQLHEAMKRGPELVVHASYLLFVAHYLERIADHTVNIAERVHYVETGIQVQLAPSHRSNS
ncbi:MAG TPA: phosphate signaling complex protein PhoU [Fimbriimonadales bacterium]|jgi:phosphate transport system protein|nr:phosphate signaling complex protein PhoU [Fimbriimonadales bacterium]